MSPVLCGVGGVEPQTEKVWYQAEKYKIPRILYINKMDRVGSDYNDVVNQIEEKLNARPLLLHLPLGVEEHFQGIIDLISMKAYRFGEDAPDFGYEIIDIPGEYLEEAEMHREHLLEKISELDLEVMELVLDKKEVSQDVIKAAIRRICLERSGFPVLMGSAFKKKGVQNLLDAILDYLPSPADMGDVAGRHPKTGETVKRKLSDDEPFASLDALTREDLQNLTIKLWQEVDLTIVLVTHNIEEAVFLSRRILVLKNIPNTSPILIENLDSGYIEYRNTIEFTKKCQQVREIVEQDMKN